MTELTEFLKAQLTPSVERKRAEALQRLLNPDCDCEHIPECLCELGIASHVHRWHPPRLWIYFLVYQGKVVYVGGTDELSRRVKEIALTTTKTFDSVYVLPSRADSIKKAITFFVRRLNPLYNTDAYTTSASWKLQLSRLPMFPKGIRTDGYDWVPTTDQLYGYQSTAEQV